MRVESVAIPVMRQVIGRPWLANLMFRFDSWGNPFSAEATADPMILAAQMREDAPMKWRAMYQQWFVLSYDEAKEVLGSPHVGVTNQIDVLLDVSPFTKLSDRSRALFGNFILGVDPPEHARLRGLVNRAFTPKQVARLDERMEEIIDGLIDGFDSDQIELMTDFAVPFPAFVIADLLGLPPEDREWVRGASNTLTKLLDVFRGFDPVEVDTVVDEVYEKMLSLAEKRRADPRDDLMTGLALAEAEDGDRLSEDELVSIAAFILIAGHETTASMIGNAVFTLHDHPDQLELIRAKPELWPNAIDELLRFETSVRADPRTAVADFEVAGNKIKKGQNIVVLNQMANRDPKRYDHPDELQLDRPDPSPLSFGHGIHYCLGANLAKAELRAALPKLLDALGDYSIDREQVEWRQSITLRGPDVLRVRRGK